MHSTMQAAPLSVASILAHASGVHGAKQVISATEQGLRAASYRQIGQRSAQLALALRRLGVTGDDRVATFQWNNQEHLEAYCAVPAMGAVLHTINIRLSADQIRYVVNHAEDTVIIVDASLTPLLAPLLADAPSVRAVVVTGGGDAVELLRGNGPEVAHYDELLAAEGDEFPWPAVEETSAAAMCYTSGTTGDPKGVVYSHRSLYLHSMAACTTNGLGIGEGDRVLPIVPMFHANAWGLPYAALMAGADLLMPDRFLQAEAISRMVHEQRPTIAGAVPTIWNDVLSHTGRVGTCDFSSLRLVVCGGSSVPRALIEAFEERLGVTVLQAWGMTETSPLAAIARPSATAPPERAQEMRTTQGRPVCGVQMRLVADDGSVLPHDGQAVGELEVRGPWVTGAYYQGADDDKFHDGWLRTGDVGRIDADGFLTLTDRAKDVIKSGGEWISSVQLENILTGHPAVFEAAVIGVPDPKWQERPLAAVVLQDGLHIAPQEIKSWLAQQVPRWWLPEQWTFIEQVPRTSVGKFDKKLLRAYHADGKLSITTVR
ncbi:long-chain fatty acid--CoA ligase [Mycobacterium vulneris]|uniref:Long-chain-fatty-acid--CoA ligase FadD13 n=1 Tax=Mycolicibacterium septicum DSM 44393 TaxID=1341646 RepID=A0A7X6MZI1_9MYCO|nr:MULTISPECIES: fatty acid--CoA ligase [Mycolicibacterium]MBX8689978.1 long-chain-fatty-acid--CoA ligase [Mycobacterium sp. 20091114027_K0903767]MCP3810911.1 fatty acid--CoA ligase [Mycobacteriaceae bacterium Msp059]OCB48249.1 long-chain fatty acid--CoA ligase [Mycolicibacterium vulneris]NKZ15779.1 fatty acid--CoA ligase [Mycolicibacterium septicum DSM 44393]OBK09302.1 long-chain fatty acid--CoA ligase [Mycolicibacterium fortuitum]